ncbi:MAG: hypothetical protein OEX03_07930 [Gammaproteobacteria bacterium]|nr:hypothetical protein [Gammaproteobacteria bacterium]
MKYLSNKNSCCFSLRLIILSFFYINISIAQDINMEWRFHVHMNKSLCQMAIWIADEQGRYVDTVYVTRKVAIKGLGNKGGGIDARSDGSRLSALPVWAHHRGEDYGGGNYYPPKGQPLIDAITSATPWAGEFVWIWKPTSRLKSGRYFYFIEVNKSYDSNEYHDYSWYRGQPSVVWKGEIVVGDDEYTSSAKIIGHGEVAGEDGSINPDVSTLTSALKLIDRARVVYRP